MRCLVVFFFNDTATTEIYTLSLHDALPIYDHPGAGDGELRPGDQRREVRTAQVERGLDAVHAHGQPARLGHGDGGRLVELPAHVGGGPQLVDGEGAARDGPQRHVVGDALAVDDHLDAVEHAGGATP